MKRFLIASLIALTAAAPGSATLLTLTFSGTLSTGTDSTGVFGASTDLAGEAVVLRFNIDTSLGTRTEAGNRLEYIGGFFYPKSAPVTSGSITVGGVTHAVGNPIFGNLIEGVAPGSLGDDIEAQVSQLSENQTGPVIHFDSLSGFSSSASNTQVTPNGFDKPFSYVPGRGDNGSAMFTVFARNIVTDDIIEDAEGSFTPTFVELRVNGAVPEAGTWVMMIVGFGATGAALRRRQQRAFQRA